MSASNSNNSILHQSTYPIGDNPIQIALNESFTTEGGENIENIIITYHTYGTYNATTSKVVWVCHALTGNSDVFDWWGGLFGENDYFNPKEYFIICANVIGSCYGSTGADHIDSTGKLYLNNFPLVTPRDMARIHEKLRVKLGIENIHLLIGSSLGGQQASEWAIEQPDIIEQLILIATNARHSAFGIAYNESQRLAIYNDATFGNGTLEDAKEGLKVARSIAMISYRSYKGYELTQTDEDLYKTDDFKSSSYQRYQGLKLANRFNAYSYITLSKAMDSHNLARGRDSIEDALAKIKARTLVIGIDSDYLFPVSEQIYLHENIKDSQYITISSDFGHDGFLVEGKQLEQIIDDFLTNGFKKHLITTFKKKENGIV